MRKLFKIFLVLGTVVFTMGVTIHFLETQLGPPRKVDRTNALRHLAEQEVEEITDTMSLENLHLHFYKACHLIGFLADSKLVDKAEKDGLMTKAMRRYVPSLAEKSLHMLGNLPWDDTQMEVIDRHAQNVQEMEYSDSSHIIDGMGREKWRIDSVREVATLYRKALRLLQEDRYESLTKSDSVMKEVDKCRQNRFLHNNTGLMKDLDTLSMRLENSHFSCLKEYVRLMGNYMSMGSTTNVLQQYAHYNSELDNYSRLARDIYGNDSLVATHLDSVCVLRKNLDFYKEGGVAYFNRKMKQHAKTRSHYGYDFKWRKAW